MTPGEAARDLFQRTYGREPDGVWFAPGRVNLLGEHTDYAGGMVLPIALAQGTAVAVALTNEPTIEAVSAFGGSPPVSVAIDAITPSADLDWFAYPAGVWWAAREAGRRVGGAQLAVASDLAVGAGLSSSAALSCSTGLALSDLFGWVATTHEVAALARRSENEIAGAPTGVMDQLASMCGVRDRALAIDTRTQEVTPVAFVTDAVRLLVIDSHTPHALVSGEYAARREAVADAERLLNCDHLALVDPARIERERAELGDLLYRRARHIVADSNRVHQAVEILRSGAVVSGLGPLFNASHISMRDDFEITAPTVDLIQRTALDAGAHGARMTGGGFGGCVIALVDAGRENEVLAACRKAAADASYPEPTAFVATAADGARRLS
ncbi:galactokinase [Calidifontibacter terrae]